MRIRSSQGRARRRRGRADGANWLSFSDLMSSLLLIFVLIMFYIMYQYFDMYEINMAEIARQQYDLDQANADLEEKSARLDETEQKMIAQQIRLDAAQKELDDAEAILDSQQKDLDEARALLDEKEAEIASQREELDDLGARLDEQQDKLDRQQEKLDQQQITMDEQQDKLDKQQRTMDEQQDKLDRQQEKLDQQQVTMDEQQDKLDRQQRTMDEQQQKLDEQQQTMETQQAQIEQLVGVRTRLIRSLSDALRDADISAQVDPVNGSIALESDVMFGVNEYELTDRGKQFIDRFLPVYLDVLFSDEYADYVSEIIIEGHTDSTGTYITNLQLSQRRALAVASYVLADDYRAITPAQKQKLRELITANGRSYSDPVLNPDGTEDMDASRRVVFKFRMTDEQMIRQLKDILERDD